MLTCFLDIQIRKPRLHKHIITYYNKKNKANRKIKVQKGKEKFRLDTSNKNSSSFIFDYSPQSN